MNRTSFRMSEGKTMSEKPEWLDAWATNATSASEPYESLFVSMIRSSARVDPEKRAMMQKYPPRCVIRFPMDGKDVYGVVVGVNYIDLDKPPKGTPRRRIAIRHVPSPLHMAGATSAEERDASYVFPEGVDVVAYSPRFTPDIMRALLSPAGCA